MFLGVVVEDVFKMKIIDNRSCKIMTFGKIKEFGYFMYQCHLYLKTGECAAFNMDKEVFSTFYVNEEVTPVSVILTIEDYKE